MALWAIEVPQTLSPIDPVRQRSEQEPHRELRSRLRAGGGGDPELVQRQVRRGNRTGSSAEVEFLCMPLNRLHAEDHNATVHEP